MKKRVLFLDHAGVLGGAELCLLDIARNFEKSCMVLLFSDGPFRQVLERVGVEVEVLPAPSAVSGVKRESGGLRNLRALSGVLRLARETARLARGYDVIYANSQKALVVGAIAGKLARRPVIWHLHDVLTADHFSNTNRRLAIVLANLMVSRVVANSEASARAFIESGGRKDKVRTVYNGIDPTPFESVTVKEVATLKSLLKIEEGAPIIGAFSRLAPWKGQHVLLEALPSLPNVYALFAGEALFGEEKYAEALREQARRLGVAERVRFLGFREDIPQLMKLVDVVVHASTAPEPFGRMIVEGMLAGRPVVASRDGGALEIIEDGKSGLLVSPGDAEVLALALGELLSHPLRGQDLAEKGHESATRRFSVGAMLDGVGTQVREVAEQRPVGDRK